ncbi:MAG TPA: hypothetical protein VGW33_10770 [Terriglobia bacterium]|nr:hypothetical protein [Terriglobia bacterium]
MKQSAEAARQRFRQLAQVEFNPKDFLPAETGSKEARDLLRAADVIDDIFWRQTSPGLGASQALSLAGEDDELRAMVLFHYGPYDRLDNDSSFLPVDPKLPGAGFYPRDLTREEFTTYIQNHADCKPSFESPYTEIRRGDHSHLVAVPYHEAYSPQVAFLSELLARAGRTESHPGFRQFLAQRAKDLLTDDYYSSDSLWVRLVDNPLDLVIGPCEVYEDQLMGLKAAYEAMLLARDFAESAKVHHFQRELPSLCRSLEAGIGNKLSVESSRVALSVANLIYAGGDARKAIPAIAFSLPNDERIIEEVGSRQVIMRNVLEAKFRLVDWQLHQRLLQIPVDNEELAFQFFFDHTLFHEISHSIGPHRIIRNGEPTTVNRSLKQHYSVLEESKADTLAACFILHMSDDSAAELFLKSYVAGFLRAIRFGLNSAHGGANAIQFNFLLQEGALSLDRESGRLMIDQPRARESLMRLVSRLIGIQECGDFEAAHRFVGAFCVMSPEIAQLTNQVNDLPIDICIRFKADHAYSPAEQLGDRMMAT